MAFFGKTRREEPDDELAALRRSVQARGPAQIDEARSYVGNFLGQVANSAGVSGDVAGMAWLRDRLRVFMVVGWDDWFNILDRIPEGPDLRQEWASLIRDLSRGPEDLVAWWWNISEPLFRPTVGNQLEEMRGALVDAAAEIGRSGRVFTNEMFDWRDLSR